MCIRDRDYDEYCPFKDTRIAKRFTVDTFRKNKVSNKLSLQEELGLDKDPKVMMLGIVSRLTDQKGFDLIDYVMDELCQDAVQIVVLGTGEAKYENMFRHFAWKYSNKVSDVYKRQGLVGSDGETHQGLFDLSFLNMIPNMTILSPKNRWEMADMVRF